MSTLVPDEISMEDPLCDSSLGSMDSLDYVNPSQFLWLQAETASKNIRISKVPGPENVADANTKPADKRSLEFCRSKMAVTEIPKQFRDAVL